MRLLRNIHLRRAVRRQKVLEREVKAVKEVRVERILQQRKENNHQIKMGKVTLQVNLASLICKFNKMLLVISRVRD